MVELREAVDSVTDSLGSGQHVGFGSRLRGNKLVAVDGVARIIIAPCKRGILDSWVAVSGVLGPVCTPESITYDVNGGVLGRLAGAGCRRGSGSGSGSGSSSRRRRGRGRGRVFGGCWLAHGFCRLVAQDVEGERRRIKKGGVSRVRLPRVTGGRGTRGVYRFQCGAGAASEGAGREPRDAECNRQRPHVILHETLCTSGYYSPETMRQPARRSLRPPFYGLPLLPPIKQPESPE